MRKIAAVDTETYLTRAGVPAPKIVCVSFAGEDEAPGLVLREEGVALMHNFLDDDWELTGQNFRYDVGCFCVEDASLFPKFVQAYEEGRIHDIGIRDTLYNLGTQGLFSEDDGEQKAKQLQFSLAEIVKRRFRVDLSEDKAKTKTKILADGSESVTMTGSATAWRLRYSELDGVPLDHWPPEAKRYAQDDAVWTMKTHKDQDAGPTIVNADMQTLSAFWLYLMGLYGVRTDPEYVAKLSTKLQKEFRIQNAILMEAGLLNEKKNPKKDWETKGQWGLARNMRQIRRRVASAYGGETALIKLEAIYRAQDMKTEAKKEAAKQLTRARAAAKKADKMREKLLAAGMVPEEVASTEPVLETTPEQDAEQDAEGGEESGTVKVVDGVPMTEKGQIATDRDTLQKLAHPKAVEAVKEAYLADVSDDSTVRVPSIRPYVDAVAGIFQLEPDAFYNELVLHETGERSEVEKLLSTFVPVLMQGTQVPVNPRWNPLVATGRTSCSRPNLQQLPRKGGVRECFIPRPGYWYGAADYSSVELCTLGQVCIDIFGFSRLADAINAGMDPHLVFAANLMGILYEEAVLRHATGDEAVGEMRQASKAANFGYPGGLGAESFREYARATYGVVMTPERAIELRAMFYTMWPEVKKYHKYIGDMSNQSHHFKIKQHRSNRVRAGCTFTSGANSLFQGLAADGAKLAGWMLMRECYLERPYEIKRPERLLLPVRAAVEVLRLEGTSPLYGSRPIGFIHDELISELPIETASEALERKCVIMSRCMSIYTPDVASKTEAALMKRWLKGAKPVRDGNGRLIPWEGKK
jgi:hypothetical protein